MYAFTISLCKELMKSRKKIAIFLNTFMGKQFRSNYYFVLQNETLKQITTNKSNNKFKLIYFYDVQ